MIDHQLFLQAISYCGYNLVLNQQDDEAWGSEADIESGHIAYRKVCKLVGFDINEDDEWGSYCIKATPEEIQQYNINQLIVRYRQHLPSEPYLYLILDGTPDKADLPSALAKLQSKIASYDNNMFNLSVHEHIYQQGFTVLRIR